MAGITWSLGHREKMQGVLAEHDDLTDVTNPAGERLENLPEDKMSEVVQHDTVERRIWVTFRHGVYDITDFLPLHPGAEKLMLAAGGSVEPFWAMYEFHFR